MIRRFAAVTAPVVAIAAVSLGCNLLSGGSDTRPVAPSVPQVRVEPEPEIVEGDAVPEADAHEFTRNEDLDGDGKLEAILFEGGTLTINDATMKVPEIPEVQLEIIDIDKKDTSHEVALIDPGLDDSAVYHVYVYREGKITYSEVPTGNGPQITGDGTLRTEWSNCGVTETKEWGLDGARVVVKSEKKVGKHDDAQCAACPFVFVYGARGARFAGEILRWQRGSEAYAMQSLPLDASAVIDGRVRVRIAERKPETTYLDSIHLAVAGRTIAPASCAREHAWCAADGRMEVIELGEHREFVFETGDVAPGTRVELWATGYYVPTTN